MNCAINSMGNLLSLDIFENEVHSEEDIIPENSNSLGNVYIQGWIYCKKLETIPCPTKTFPKNENLKYVEIRNFSVTLK